MRSLRLRYKLYMLACYISLGRYAAANDLIKECDELSILVSDKLLTGQIMLYQAKLYLQQGKVQKAMMTLANAQYSSSLTPSDWLSSMLRIELAHCLSKAGKAHFATMLLGSTEKRLQN
ncbi:diguanylate cyclase, partial [Vibrio cholerae]